MSLDKSNVCGSLDKSNINRGFILGGGHHTSIAANLTTYYYVNGGINNVNRLDIRVPFDCVIDELRAQISVAAGAGDSVTFTLMDDAGASALTCQIAGGADLEGEDLVNQVAVDEDDRICMRVVTSATCANVRCSWSMKVIPTGA